MRAWSCKTHESDPNEFTNLAKDEKHAQTVERMKRLLRRAHDADRGEVIWKGPRIAGATAR